MARDDAIDARQLLAASGIMVNPSRRIVAGDTRRSGTTGAVRNILQGMFATGRKIFLGGQHEYVMTGSTLKLYDNMVLEGESLNTVLSLAGGMNTSLIGNIDTTNGNSGITIRNLTLDQNGALQTAGGCFSATGLRNCLFENVTFKTSFSFNFFCGSLAGTPLTGTLTFTNGSDVVTGSGTAFTTEVSKGDILKTAGAHFIRVRAIITNTSLRVERDFGWATETGVATNKVPANSRNTFINCRFEGNPNNDNGGFGLFDYSTFINCKSYNATNGYGFGPDHSNFVTFENCESFDNENSGIGMETCGFSRVSGGSYYRNGNGILLLSGSYRNRIVGVHSYDNENGFNITYNNTGFPQPHGNSFIGCTGSTNGVHGFRIGGSKRNIVTGCRAIDNSSTGIVTTTENAITPDYNVITNNQLYDAQTTKVQDRGIHILNGDRNLVANNLALDTDHTIAGIVDAGTNTVLANNITA